MKKQKNKKSGQPAMAVRFFDIERSEVSMKQVELLSPAGSMDSLKAAIGAGCDAIYIGGSMFGARAYAKNPEEELLLRAIDYSNLHGKKLYLTVNTLIKTQEMEEKLYDYLYPYYGQGLSAVIVQDVGAIRLIHREFPKLPIHASTQMTLTMAEGGNLLIPYGVTRLVMARELSFQELERVRNHTSLELETFIHGALCYCYSGQCLMSSMIGGRSGNRGRCAQPCRRKYYQLNDTKGNFLLSPKDICTLYQIPKLMESGIDSFKIEGRMKHYEYVAGVTAAYRKQITLYQELGREGYQNYHNKHPKELEMEMQILQDLYNRGGFCSGYYEEKNGPKMMSMRRPNHSGVLVGRVKEVDKKKAVLWLDKPLYAGDVLELREEGSPQYEFTVKEGKKKDTSYVIPFLEKSKIRQGDFVYRTKNKQLLLELSKQYFETQPKILVEAVFTAANHEPIRLMIRCYSKKMDWIVVTGETAAMPKKQPVSKERIQIELEKMGDTLFELRNAEIQLKEAVFFSMGGLKELRRKALSSLTEKILEEFRRECPKKTEGNEDSFQQRERRGQREKMKQTTCVRTWEQLEAVCDCEMISEVYLDVTDFEIERIVPAKQLCISKKKRFFFALPSVFRAKTYDFYCDLSSLLCSEDVSGYLIRNFEEFSFLKEKLAVQTFGKEIRLDYMMYTMNPEAKQFFYELGASQMTAPIELNGKELRQLDITEMELLIYGRLPLMTSAQCLYKNTSGCLKNGNVKIEKGKPLWIKDQKGKKFPALSHCRDCFSSIYNSDIYSIWDTAFGEELRRLNPKAVRWNFTLETKQEVSQILKRPDGNEGNYTRGHFRRGVE